MGTMASQITSLTVVYSTIYSGADQRKHQSSAQLAFVRGIHRGPIPAQMASNAEKVSIWWRHHVLLRYLLFSCLHIEFGAWRYFQFLPVLHVCTYACAYMKAIA